MSDDYKPVLRPGYDPVVFFKMPGQEPGGAVARGHVMAAVIARNLRDGEVVVMGANSMVPLAGARLAQLTHAPNLSIIAGASGGINPLLEPLAPSSGDYANLVAEAAVPFPDVLLLHMGGRCDVFFAGGFQIDARGNCNLAYTGGAERPSFRGPGSAGLPWGASSRRIVLYTTSHTRRVFVPTVDFVSLAGWSEGEGPGKGDTPGRPVLVVTPLCVFDFGPTGVMRLQSVHEGATLEQVRDNTGFDFEASEKSSVTTPPPTDSELRIMRDFDVDGLLSIVAE
jgi:glutaconate CoA-transferase subunit B